jgi:hypothetical protein
VSQIELRPASCVRRIARLAAEFFPRRLSTPVPLTACFPSDMQCVSSVHYFISQPARRGARPNEPRLPSIAQSNRVNQSQPA